jgi:hypothetical protein
MNFPAPGRRGEVSPTRATATARFKLPFRAARKPEVDFVGSVQQNGRVRETVVRIGRRRVRSSRETAGDGSRSLGIEPTHSPGEGWR